MTAGCWDDPPHRGHEVHAPYADEWHWGSCSAQDTSSPPNLNLDSGNDSNEILRIRWLTINWYWYDQWDGLPILFSNSPMTLIKNWMLSSLSESWAWDYQDGIRQSRDFPNLFIRSQPTWWQPLGVFSELSLDLILDMSESITQCLCDSARLDIILTDQGQKHVLWCSFLSTLQASLFP